MKGNVNKVQKKNYNGIEVDANEVKSCYKSESVGITQKDDSKWDEDNRGREISKTQTEFQPFQKYLHFNVLTISWLDGSCPAELLFLPIS